MTTFWNTTNRITYKWKVLQCVISFFGFGVVGFGIGVVRGVWVGVGFSSPTTNTNNGDGKRKGYDQRERKIPPWHSNYFWKGRDVRRKGKIQKHVPKLCAGARDVETHAEIYSRTLPTLRHLLQNVSRCTTHQTPKIPINVLPFASPLIVQNIVIASIQYQKGTKTIPEIIPILTRQRSSLN
jgi:hypothetical protein